MAWFDLAEVVGGRRAEEVRGDVMGEGGEAEVRSEGKEKKGRAERPGYVRRQCDSYMWAVTCVSASTVEPNVWSGNTDTQHPLPVSPSEEMDPSSVASITSCLNLFLGRFFINQRRTDRGCCTCADCKARGGIVFL